MVFVRVLFVCCSAWLTCAIPVVNVIAEQPFAVSTAERGDPSLEAMLVDIEHFVREVREQQHDVGTRAKGVLRAQSLATVSAKGNEDATGFADVRGARADAAHLAALLDGVAGGGGEFAVEPLVGASADIPDAEVPIRKMLLEANRKFSTASGVNAARAASTGASFLQSVDANRLRGSLHATEPMAISPPMAVNVIMTENARAMQHGVGQLSAVRELKKLNHSIEGELLALEGP